MRPSRRLLGLAIGLAGLTALLIAAALEAGLLVAAVWGLLGAFAFLDLMLSQGRRSLQAEIDVPETGFVGESAPLRLMLGAKRGRLPADLQMRLDHDPGLESAEIHLPPERGDETRVTLKIPLLMTERGEQALRRLSLKYRSRFGLFELISDWPIDAKLTVLPNIRPVLDGDIQTQLKPLMDGLKDIRMRGEGSEFHQLRDFTPGMDPRTIDWKRSARMRELIARETLAERNHQIMLAIDTGHLMSARIGTLAKVDHAINAALALAWAGGLGGDKVGLFSFNSQPQTLIPPQPGRTVFSRMQATCAVMETAETETNHTLGLTHLDGKLSRRSLVVIFSDFVDSVTAELLVENAAVMARRHLVLYVALSDPALQALARSDETNLDAIARAVTARQMLKERRVVLDRLGRLGVLCLDTEPKALTGALISRYIDIKAQELI